MRGEVVEMRDLVVTSLKKAMVAIANISKDVIKL
jgi:hypothetical protein